MIDLRRWTKLDGSSGVLAQVPIYTAFAATGAGVALPGALLPALLFRWHLKDEQGGLLFLMAWIGSSVGALLVRGSLRMFLILGSLLVAFAALALGFCEGGLADVWMGLYGVGLGMVMTTISLIRQQQVERTGAEMVRLNLLWAVGACVCPTLTVRALTLGAIRPLLLGLGLVFACAAGWAVFLDEVGLRGHSENDGSWLEVFRATPFALIVMIVVITGVEATAGGWLATFARRTAMPGSHVVASTIAAPTCLWAGLLVSRFVWSVWEARFSESGLVRGSLALMSVASVLLVAHQGGGLMLLSAFLMGFGIGPIYPLILAWSLRFRGGGAIFFLAGVGSATLPWLTGILSSRSDSLRVGMVVPMAGTLLMCILAFASPLRDWSGDPTSIRE